MTAIAKPTAQARGWPALPAHGALLMGVLNVTPNSFSDGGVFASKQAALAQARRIIAEGADILDVGGESTHPLAAPVDAEEELARVRPVLEALSGTISVPLSIDTYKAAVAKVALDLGAAIVNDVWGLQRDPDLAAVVAEFGAGVCLMHNRTGFDPALDVIGDIRRFFDRSLTIAERAGIRREAIVLDPGIGFGKTFNQNLFVLNRLDQLTDYGLPLLIGCSRKGFIGKITGQAVAADRLSGSLGAHVAAVLKGARIVRAHDIAAHREALAVVAAFGRETTD